MSTIIKEPKSIERQIYEYCQKFEKTSEFREKNDIEIELENGYVIMEYSMKSGTVYVDKFIDDDEMNLSIEQKTHLKYQFVEAIEKRYNALS